MVVVIFPKRVTEIVEKSNVSLPMLFHDFLFFFSYSFSSLPFSKLSIFSNFNCAFRAPFSSLFDFPFQEFRNISST